MADIVMESDAKKSVTVMGALANWLGSDSHIHKPSTLIKTTHTWTLSSLSHTPSSTPRPS